MPRVPPSRPLAGRVDSLSEAKAVGVGGLSLLRVCGPTPHPFPPRRKSGGREEFAAREAPNKTGGVLHAIFVICDSPALEGGGKARARRGRSDCDDAGSGGPTQSTAGFTLVEMLVVVTILALAAGVAMPMLARPSDTVRLTAAARDLVGALRTSRAAAVARNAEVALTIDVDRRTFESPVALRRSLGADLTAQLVFAEPERRGRSGAFRFFPDGSATGGDVRLALNGKNARICVDWLSGEARTC